MSQASFLSRKRRPRRARDRAVAQAPADTPLGKFVAGVRGSIRRGRLDKEKVAAFGAAGGASERAARENAATFETRVLCARRGAGVVATISRADRREYCRAGTSRSRPAGTRRLPSCNTSAPPRATWRCRTSSAGYRSQRGSGGRSARRSTATWTTTDWRSSPRWASAGPRGRTGEAAANVAFGRSRCPRPRPRA